MMIVLQGKRKKRGAQGAQLSQSYKEKVEADALAGYAFFHTHAVRLPSDCSLRLAAHRRRDYTGEAATYGKISPILLF